MTNEKTESVNTDQVDAKSTNVDEHIDVVDLNSINDVNALKSFIERSETSRKRILQESKNYKNKYVELKAQREEEEKKRLEEQNNYKALYEKVKSSEESLKKELVRQRVDLALQQSAQKAGWDKPVSTLLKLGNTQLLQIDDDGNVNGVDEFIEDAKKEYAPLFKQVKSATINAMVPNGVDKTKKLTALDISKLPKKERDKAMMELYSRRK